MKTPATVYDIYLVPNGRLADFGRGILGTGYPDACKCWGTDMTVDEARERYRKLADENFRRDGGEYDRIWDEADDRVRAEIETLTDGWYVLDDEGYGSVAGIYREIPTNRQFWAA